MSVPISTPFVGHSAIFLGESVSFLGQSAKSYLQKFENSPIRNFEKRKTIIKSA